LSVSSPPYGVDVSRGAVVVDASASWGASV
jgi:hypothetical protein